MVDINSIVEGNVKFRDGKKWKNRWCIMRKISPVADCLHLQFYKDSKERYKNGPTKASLSLQHFLGIETGFTFDKESNTIAILCEDVIVILAFDTREVALQWQVKISNNLGDDVQYLVLVASSTTKLKIAAGPARLHIQNHRFCITTGIPPRLTGMWHFNHLRRYGIVDNRFCFEGGSSSGKCEGFVVLISDFSEEISNCFKLASQGKLSSNNNRYSRALDGSSSNGSPRRMKDTQSLKCDCSSSSSFWPSQESRGLDFCDSSSLNDEIDSSDDLSHLSRTRSKATMERCMSCSSRRNPIPSSMSRSTIAETDHEDKFFDGRPLRFRHHHPQMPNNKMPLTPDQISMRSQESCPNFTEYSVPRQFYQHSNGSGGSGGGGDDMSSVRSISVPPRKVVMRNFVGSYENYDSPRILSPASDGNQQEENYDRPRSIKMYLEQSSNGQQQPRHLNFNGDNGNYSKPTVVHCCVNGGGGSGGQELSSSNCTCHKVMSWADNWMPCKRGNGIENTGVIVSRLNPSTPTTHLHHHQVIAQEPSSRCKLNDFSSTQSISNGNTAQLYACVDPGKKNQSKRIIELQQQQPAYEELRCNANNVNANYMNLSFERSLENYENVREVLKREKALTSQSNDNYIVMENHQHEQSNMPDYIPMHAPQQQQQQQQKEQEKEEEIPPPAPAKDYEVIQEEKQSLLIRKSRSLDDLKLIVECIEWKKSPSCSALVCFQREIHVDASAIYENIGANRTAIVESIEQQLKEEHVYVECDSTQANRDSSGSNDSGVSASSSTIRNELIDRPAISAKTKRRLQLNQQVRSCVHASLIRKSRSFDPFGDSIHFQFNPVMSNNRTLCNNLAQNQSNKCPSLGAIMTGNTIDTNSTSSGTSDMSDYIETLSLSSYSSCDADALRHRHSALHHTINTMRPRSGKEYEKIDRAAIGMTHQPTSLPPIIASTSSLNPN